MNENFPENLNEKGVEVNENESMEDIVDLPKLEPATMEPTPLLHFEQKMIGHGQYIADCETMHVERRMSEERFVR